MIKENFRETAKRLATAFRLTTQPLAVYGSETLPARTTHLPELNRCFAVALYTMATEKEPSAIYVSADSREGCCPGGLAHTGFQPIPEDIRYFVSTGRENFRNGAAEYLKASPDLVERCFKALGKITPPGKYLIVQTCETLPEKNPGIRRILAAD